MTRMRSFVACIEQPGASGLQVIPAIVMNAAAAAA